MSGCGCIWDCSHAWCGCPVHLKVVCVCGVRPKDCPVHLQPDSQNQEDYS